MALDITSVLATVGIANAGSGALKAARAASGATKAGGVAKGAGKTLELVRTAIQSVDDVFAYPTLLETLTREEVQATLGLPDGWVAGTLAKGNNAGQGWTLRQMNASGTDYTDLYIQYHPGTSRHYGGQPYWKVSSGQSGVQRFPAKRK